ncbi:MAG: sigma-70 family RNA polymerase sigma factor [Phycisphaerales bacterium]|nr:MAG: sigma-70 family RNA polymerase sigma factor [Phycisphaerales bacterium]
MEDRFLVFQCQRGCRQALARIYEKYKHDLVRLAMALLNDAGTAEDVVHDVFVQFAQGLEGFRLTGSLKGYLMTCVANRARNCNRAKRVVASASTEPAGCRDIAPSPVERIECSEQLLRLAHALDQLSYDHREVAALHLYGQMSFRAIGKQLKIPVSTAKSRYQQGLIKLRRLVGSEVDV